MIAKTIYRIIGDPKPMSVANANINLTTVESMPKRFASPPQTPNIFLSWVVLTNRDIMLLFDLG